MDTTQDTPAFPVETHFTVTDDIARDSKSALKEAVLPAWIQILLPTVIVIQLIIQLPKLIEGANPAIAIGVLAPIGAIYGLLYWRGKKREDEARKFIIEKQVFVIFFEDGFDLGRDVSNQRIDYSSITRIGRDERGLVMIFGRVGGLFIPTSAFKSPTHRDWIFDYVGRVIRKSRASR